MQSSIDVESFANVMEVARDENYREYNKEYKEKNGQVDSKISFVKILDNYIQKISNIKFNGNISLLNNFKSFSKIAIEHLTGDYEIGTGNVSFEDLTEYSENISSVIAYSNEEKLAELVQNPEELANGIVDGVVGYSLIPSKNNEEALNKFNISSEKIKKLFRESLSKIANINKIFANTIAHISGLDSDKSKGLNDNIIGKMLGGIGYELLSGTLVAKRHFTDVKNSQSIQDVIKKEGILHFTSPSNIEKIMKSQKIKASNFLESDLTKNKSFFFAGIPTFEDLLINIPAYDVMTAIRIRPTEEQLEELKYRALNDRAVVKDGEFNFSKEQAEVAYFGLMFDEEKNNIYLGELSEDQVKDFKVSDKVRQAYHYKPQKNTLINSIKMNAYGLFAEYKHHQKLLQMEEKLKEKGISFRDVDDSVLVELADIEQAYISTEEKSIERRNLFETIKQGILQKNNEKVVNQNKEQEKSEINENDRSI